MIDNYSDTRVFNFRLLESGGFTQEQACAILKLIEAKSMQGNIHIMPELTRIEDDLDSIRAQLSTMQSKRYISALDTVLIIIISFFCVKLIISAFVAAFKAC